MARFMMCPPKYFAIEYEINPWMSRLHGSNPDLANAQWQHLVNIIRDECGAQIDLIEPQPGLPDLVFTANAGLIIDQQVILSRFRFPVRTGEEPVFDAWFKSAGIEVLRLGDDIFFEGAGDALFSGDQLFCGYHFRSEIASHHAIAETTGQHVLSLLLTNSRFYHLDTCFCPLSGGRVMYYPGAFDEYAIKVIEAHVPERIEISDADAAKFGGNAVCIDDHVVLPAGCPQLAKDLTSHGYRIHSVNLSEYLKSGGAAKCLTIRLDQNHP